MLTDLQSLYRDVLMIQFGRTDPTGGSVLINRELDEDLRALAAAWSPQRTLVVLDEIARTRRNLEQNVAPTLALESLLITVSSGRTP